MVGYRWRSTSTKNMNKLKYINKNNSYFITQFYRIKLNLNFKMILKFILTIIVNFIESLIIKQ